ERLSDNSRLPLKSRRPCPLLVSAAFQMQEETRQLEVNMAETIDDSDAVILQYRPSFCGGLVRYKEKRSIRTGLGFVDQLPRGCRIRALPDLDADVSLSSGMAEDGIDSSLAAHGLGYHGQPPGRPLDAKYP